MTCPTCGHSVDALAITCPRCGAAAPRDVASSAAVTAPQPPLRSPLAHLDSGRFTPGERIGERYRMVSLLGRGGMGEVYRADDLRLDQPVALKFLPENLERDAAWLERLLSEVRTARQITHPNVCRVYDIGEVDGRRFISMEYIDGENLASLLRRIGRLATDKAIQIARQLCAGLAAIHEREVLHRDLKPANVMIDGRGRPRLTDLGLAVPAINDERDISGTLEYMAPEQLAGHRLSVQSDLYSLGLVLYELFTGERVHTSRTSPEGREAERAAAVTRMASSPAGLEPAVQRVIERCLEPDPRRRPPSALAIAAALPGKDPLSAALAAGETPSPQMVAEAGDAGALTVKTGVACLITLVALVALVVWVHGQRHYFSIVTLPHSPEVLTTKAREMIGRLGYTEGAVDAAIGFTRNLFDYSRWLNQQPHTPDRWRHVSTITPPVLWFWYRDSPEPMNPGVYFSGAPGGGVRVTVDDPPLTTPGMRHVELSFEGRLLSLRVVLPERQPAPGEPKAPEWSRLFAEAGLEMSRFTPVSPEWLPGVAADVRAAWIGPAADATGLPLRVEAAEFQGRPVFFRLIAPWTRPYEGPQPLRQSAVARLGDQLANVIVAAVLISASALAIRNLRLGRSDRRGAVRLATIVGTIELTAGALASHYGGPQQSLETLAMLASWGGLLAVIAWTSYTAIEPYVRRRWPEMLIGWTRALEGRWRDPLVGRALLLGTLIGVGRALVFQLPDVVAQGSIAYPVVETWSGPLTLAAVVLQYVTRTPVISLLLIVFLIVLRTALRSERAAIVAFVALPLLGFSLVQVGGGRGLAVQLFFFIAAGLSLWGLVWAATRLGLVALIMASLIPNLLATTNVAFPHPHFLRPTVVFGIFLVLGIGLFGFYTSLAREKLNTNWLD